MSGVFFLLIMGLSVLLDERCLFIIDNGFCELQENIKYSVNDWDYKSRK